MIFIKQKIDKILITLGIILIAIFYVIIKVNDIPVRNNIIGIVGALTMLPMFIGLFIYGKRKKNVNLGLSISLRWISIIYFVAIGLGSLLVLL